MRKNTIATVGGVIAVIFCALVGTFWCQYGIENRRFRSYVGNSYLRCDGNLRQIAMTLTYYHRALGRFPPAVEMDRSGTPMCSWRCILLPFTDFRAFDPPGYRFEEIWESDENRRFGELPIKIYQCKTDPSKRALPGYTSFFYLRDYCDQRRVVLIECHGADVRWTEPKDLDLRELGALLRRRFESAAKPEATGLAVIGETARVFAICATNADDFVAEIDRDVRICIDN